MDKGFSLSCSSSFLKPEIRTSEVSSVAKNNVRRRVTPLLVLLFLLFPTGLVVGQGTQSEAAALIAEAKSLWKKNDNEKALVIIQKAISVDPRNAAAYVQLALIHAELGDDNKARLAVEEALKIDPNYAPAHQQRGSQLRRAKDFEGAIREAKLALSLKPDLEFAGYAHLTLARTYEELKRYDEAINEYREAIHSDPADGFLHGSLGFALFSLRRYDEAETAYRRAVEINPLDSNAVADLAASLHNQAKRDEAIKYYREYLRLQPKASNRAAVEQQIALLERTPEPLFRNEMLIVMAQEGDAANAAALIKSGADPNYIVKSPHRPGRIEEDITALTLAVQRDNAAVVRVLLTAGADVKNKSLLRTAAGAPYLADGDVPKNELPRLTSEVLQLLLDKGLSAKSPDGDSALLVAKSIERVKLLLAGGANPNAKGAYGSTPLLAAADRGNSQSVDALLSAGADVNAQDDEGDTPLLKALDPDRRRNVEHYPVLVRALLRAKNINANAQNKNGETALMRAVRLGNAESVVLLVGVGANTHMADKLGDTAYTLAYYNGNAEIEKLLTTAAAPQKTPGALNAFLVAAIRKKDAAKVKKLLDQGADPNYRYPIGLNRPGITSSVLIMAARGGDAAIVQMLVDKGADVNAEGLISWRERGLEQGTPLEVATNPQVIEILKKAATKKN
jgi:ankyrin repeat protein/Tfp pilus assembly protein PilF